MFKIQKIKNKLLDLFHGGFFHIFTGNILVKLIAFISSIVIVRLVDKVDYAYLAYADNLYNYVISFAGMGMTAAVLKYCATATTKEENKAYFIFALKYGTLFQIMLSLLIICYVTFGNIAFPAARPIVYVLVLYPVLNNILNVIMNYLRAHRYNQLYAKIAVVQTAIVFLGSIVFVKLWGILGIASARYLAIFAAALFSAALLKSSLGNVTKVKLSKKATRTFFIMSLSLMVSNLFSLIMPINEMTLVNELLRNEVVTANYKIAIMIPGQLPFVTQSIIVYYFTIVAKMERGEDIWKLSKRVGLVTAGIIVGLTIVGAVLTPVIIRSVYGSRYEDAITLSVVFWIVNALNAAVRMVPMNFLPAIGIAKFNAIMAGVSCILHLGLTYGAIQVWGIWGAGIATGIVYLVSGAAYWLYYRKKCLKI